MGQTDESLAERLSRVLKRCIRGTALWKLALAAQQYRLLWNWERSGRAGPPPPLVKRWIVKSYGRRHSLETFIETGTCLGDMIEATKRSFIRIHSIELDGTLWREARERFSRCRHVSIHHGDSGAVLSSILQRMSTPALFWLDAHYSEGRTAKGEMNTPVLKEMKAILDHAVVGDVVLIDDARLFDGTNDYPSVEEIRRLVFASRGVAWVVKVKNDIIRIHSTASAERRGIWSRRGRQGPDGYPLSVRQTSGGGGRGDSGSLSDVLVKGVGGGVGRASRPKS